MEFPILAPLKVLEEGEQVELPRLKERVVLALRHHRPMTCATRRIIAAATMSAGLLVTAASAATQTESFTAVFHDRPCGANRLCGDGVIGHYGRVTTITVFSRPTPGPEPGCQIFKGTRTATLAKNKRSTLRFAIQGPACGAHAWGTFRIVSGTGTFSNASGSGVIWGAPWLVHYYGVIRTRSVKP